MEPINSLLMGVQEKLGGFSGLFRGCCDTTTDYNSRLIKRASARIYIGGDDYYCQFLRELAMTEIKKDVKDRGVALLVVDNKSMKKISSTTIAGASLKDKLVELGVELITAKKILSFHEGQGRSVEDYKKFYSTMGKIKFNNDDRSESEIRRIESVARKARLTLQAENYKHLIPEFVFANYDVTIASVMDLDTRAPLVPQNIAKKIIENSSNTLTLSAYMHEGKMPHLIDNDCFHTLSEIKAVPADIPNLGMLKKMHPVVFKPDYSFIEFRMNVYLKYTDAVFNCFIDDFYNNNLWIFQQGEKFTGIPLSDYDKTENFIETGFDEVFISRKSEEGMQVRFSTVGNNKAKFFKNILSYYNGCMVNQKVNGLMRYIHEVGLHKKVLVCNDDLSTDFDIFPREYCRKVSENNSKKIIFNFHGSKILLLGYKDDVVKAISGVMSSPCRDWSITSTVANLRWDIDNDCGTNCQVLVPCIRAGNTLRKFGDDTTSALVLSDNILSFNQPLDNSLLPVELTPSYFQYFVNGGVFGGVSFLMDKCVGEKVVRQCPRLKTLYQLGRNVLFGGPVFGSFQTVFSQVCDRLLFHEMHETSTQGWRRSTAEFCLRNGLLFIPVVQGSAIPAALSMTGAMCSQYVLRKIVQRLSVEGNEN